MGLALRAEHAPQRFLGRGLADRSGDRDDARAETRSRGVREIDQAGEHVIDHQQRRVGGKFLALRGFNNRQRRACVQGRRDKIMAVVHIALDRKVGFARRDGAAVDGKA